MGRNIWQSDNPVAMIKAVRAIVHENFTVKEAFDQYSGTSLMTEAIRKKARDKTVSI